MSYLFFFSHAKEDMKADEKILRKFYENIVNEININTGQSKENIGFLDESTIEHGEPWHKELKEALNTCKVFLAIYSPLYFQSEWCGKEWHIFSQRLKNNEPLILPVLWTVHEFLDTLIPEFAGKLQYGKFPDEYKEYGLRRIMEQRHEDKFKTIYLEIVRGIADKVIYLDREYKLPDGNALPSFDKIPSAFHSDESLPSDEKDRSISKGNIILYYGSRDALENEQKSIYEKHKDISIQLSLKNKNIKDFLDLFIDAIGKIHDINTENIKKELKEALVQAEQKASDDKKWEYFLENSIEALKQFLEKTLKNKQIVLFLNKFEDISTPLKTAFETKLFPCFSKIPNLKLFLFYQGNRQPSWEKYYGRDYIEIIPLISKELSDFKNPYIAGRPIRSNSFSVLYGRDDIAEKIFREILNKRNVFLTGEIKIGKSSFLYNFEKLAQKIDQKEIDKYIFINIDLKDLDESLLKKNPVSALLWFFAYKIYGEFRNRKIELKDLSKPQLSDFSDMPIHEFNEKFLKVLIDIEEQKKLILLIDEFDRIYALSDYKEFFAFLKAHFDRPDRIGFIFAGKSNLKNFINQYPEHFLGVGHYKIPVLDEVSARKLIKEPVKDVIEYEKDAVDYILSMCGTHPFLLQTFCYHITEKAIQHLQNNQSLNDIKRITDKVCEEVEEVFNVWWKFFNDREQRALLGIIDEKKTDQSIIKQLIEKNILKSTENSQFYSGLFYRWVRKKAEAKKIEYISDAEQRYNEEAKFFFNKAEFENAIKYFREALNKTGDGNRRWEYELLIKLASAYKTWLSGNHHKSYTQLTRLSGEIEKTSLLSEHKKKISTQAKISKDIAGFEKASLPDQGNMQTEFLYLLLYTYNIGEICLSRENYGEAILKFHIICEKTCRFQLYLKHGIDAENAKLNNKYIYCIKKEKSRLLKKQYENIKLAPMEYIDMAILLKCLNDPVIKEFKNFQIITSCASFRNNFVHNGTLPTSKQIKQIEKLADKYIRLLYDKSLISVDISLERAKDNIGFIKL